MNKRKMSTEWTTSEFIDMCEREHHLDGKPQKIVTKKSLIAIKALFTAGIAAISLILAGFAQGCAHVDESIPHIVSISSNYKHAVGLYSDGTVAVAGTESYYLGAESWTDIVAVATGMKHTVGLKSDGTVVACSDYIEGEEHKELEVGEWENIVAISADDYYTIGLRSDGTVVFTRDMFPYYRPSAAYGIECIEQVNGWRDIVAIDTEEGRIVGLKADGTVVGTGENDFSGWTDITAISTGGAYTVGLHKDGTVSAVGLNYKGRCDVQDWKDIVAVVASTFTMGLKKDGTVVTAGDTKMGVFEDWTDVVSIEADAVAAYGIRSDGTILTTDISLNNITCDVKTWSPGFMPAEGEKGITADGLIYYPYQNSVFIHSCKSDSSSIVIPSMIDSKPVTWIGKMAFHDKNELKSITIPNSVTQIESDAFMNCK